MSESIPGNVVRNIIADILFERANCIDDISDAIDKHEAETIACNTEFVGEVCVTSCGTRVLSDDIREGIISIEEAVEALTPTWKKSSKKEMPRMVKGKARKFRKMNYNKK